MARTYHSRVSVVWEEAGDREVGINMPIIGEREIHFSARLRAVQEKGTIQIELEASRRRWRYALADACHTPLDWGLGRLTLCMKVLEGGVQLVLSGAVAVHTISKGWPLISKDLRFVPMSCLAEGELMMLGFAEPSCGGYRLDPREEVGTLASYLTSAEQEAVLLQPPRS